MSESIYATIINREETFIIDGKPIDQYVKDHELYSSFSDEFKKNFEQYSKDLYYNVDLKAEVVGKNWSNGSPEVWDYWGGEEEELPGWEYYEFNGNWDFGEENDDSILNNTIELFEPTPEDQKTWINMFIGKDLIPVPFKDEDKDKDQSFLMNFNVDADGSFNVGIYFNKLKNPDNYLTNDEIEILEEGPEL